MNLTAPMQPSTATAENQATIAKLRSSKDRYILVFWCLLLLLAFRYAIAGNTKSSGVNPIAPHIDTKSPKNGMAAATSVMRAIYMEVQTSRTSLFRSEERLVGVSLDSSLSSK